MNPDLIPTENSFEVPTSMSRDIRMSLKSSIDDHFYKVQVELPL
jgi:hypothetical protein